jgi:hypothetical protein
MPTNAVRTEQFGHVVSTPMEQGSRVRSDYHCPFVLPNERFENLSLSVAQPFSLFSLVQGLQLLGHFAGEPVSR